MLRERTMRWRLVHLLLLLSLSVCFGACATPTRVGVNCPKPTEAEIDDYVRLIYQTTSGNTVRPVVVWMSRVVGYCWPYEAEDERRSPLPDE